MSKMHYFSDKFLPLRYLKTSPK